MAPYFTAFSRSSAVANSNCKVILVFPFSSSKVTWVRTGSGASSPSVPKGTTTHEWNAKPGGLWRYTAHRRGVAPETAWFGVPFVGRRAFWDRRRGRARARAHPRDLRGRERKDQNHFAVAIRNGGRTRKGGEVRRHRGRNAGAGGPRRLSREGLSAAWVTLC